MTKFAGAERGVLPDEDLARVDEAVEHAVEFGFVDDDLQVFGGEFVGDRDGRVEIVDDHTASVRSE